ncbi:MAG: PRC-barrel domain-containing protein [Endomicrobium sp.]|jgi:16S rRNA processing protein RimM|nr:PRC-barrel domain-containing protein [Endomicrobium sp.]
MSNIKRGVSEINIIGFEVFDQNGKKIGTLCDVILTNNNDLLIVKHHNNEILIPALKGIVNEINVLRRKIFVVMPKEYENIYKHVMFTDDFFDCGVRLFYEN